MKVAVTGANGFLGAEVCRVLTDRGHSIVRLDRSHDQAAYLHDKKFLTNKLAGVNAVIHLAARAHVLRDTARDPLAEFRRVNVEGTANVANAAVTSGVARFVLVSSIGVFGNASGAAGFSEESAPAPVEPYAMSKLEAEQALIATASRSNLETVIVRPPLVYGPKVQGNFLRLLRLVHAGFPLPFGSVSNIRSFIGLENLAELLGVCVIERRAAGELFVVSDGDDVSLPELLRWLAASLHRPAYLFPCSDSLLKLMACALGKREELAKLVCNLRVDSSKVRRVLAWHPSKDLGTGIAEMGAWYLSELRSSEH